MSQIFNFCAGPAMLPVEVMEKAQLARYGQLSHGTKPS